MSFRLRSDCYVAWNPAGTGFYYNRGPNPADVPEGEENFHMRVYFHKVGTHYDDDPYVWGEGRPVDEEPQAYSSSDYKYVLLNFYRDPAEDDLFLQAGRRRRALQAGGGWDRCHHARRCGGRAALPAH